MHRCTRIITYTVNRDKTYTYRHTGSVWLYWTIITELNLHHRPKLKLNYFKTCCRQGKAFYAKYFRNRLLQVCTGLGPYIFLIGLMDYQTVFAFLMSHWRSHRGGVTGTCPLGAYLVTQYSSNMQQNTK